MLRAYADEHVIAPLVEALRTRGMDVITVQEQGWTGMSDANLLAESLRAQRILLTNDQDFLGLASRCATQGELFAPIFFWPQQQRTIGKLIRNIIREANRDNYASICSRIFFL